MKKINNRSKTPNENDDVTIREVLTADIKKKTPIMNIIATNMKKKNC